MLTINQMARDFDPNNLTARDVFWAFAPIIAAIGAIFFVNMFLPDFVGLAIVALVVLLILGIRTIPKKDLEAAAEGQRRLDEKINAVPIVGPALGILLQTLDWLGSIFAVVIFAWLVYWGVGNAFLDF